MRVVVLDEEAAFDRADAFGSIEHCQRIRREVRIAIKTAFAVLASQAFDHSIVETGRDDAVQNAARAQGSSSQETFGILITDAEVGKYGAAEERLRIAEDHAVERKELAVMRDAHAATVAMLDCDRDLGN